MPTQMPSDQPAKWLGLPVIVTIVRILCRELTLQNKYPSTKRFTKIVLSQGCINLDDWLNEILTRKERK